jgi:hypothetical protein
MARRQDAVRRESGEAVDMTAGQPGRWLETEEARSVGQKSSGSAESTGHEK